MGVGQLSESWAGSAFVTGRAHAGAILVAARSKAEAAMIVKSSMCFWLNGAAFEGRREPLFGIIAIAVGIACSEPARPRRSIQSAPPCFPRLSHFPAGSPFDSLPLASPTVTVVALEARDKYQPTLSAWDSISDITNSNSMQVAPPPSPRYHRQLSLPSSHPDPFQVPGDRAHRTRGTRYLLHGQHVRSWIRWSTRARVLLVPTSRPHGSHRDAPLKIVGYLVSTPRRKPSGFVQSSHRCPVGACLRVLISTCSM